MSSFRILPEPSKLFVYFQPGTKVASHRPVPPIRNRNFGDKTDPKVGKGMKKKVGKIRKKNMWCWIPMILIGIGVISMIIAILVKLQVLQVQWGCE